MEDEEKYHTHPDEMRGATRRKQNTMMHRQLKAFDALQRALVERHDTSSLYHVLARLVPYNRSVRSVSALFRHVDQWHAEHEWSDQDQTIAEDLMNFRQTFQILKQMKATFDERIYSVLFEFYYEMVMEEIPQAFRAVDKDRRAGEIRAANFLEMSNLDDYSMLKEAMPARALYDISNECEKLFAIINQLQRVNVRWGMLLKADEVDTGLFDEQSVDEVKRYPNYMRFEALLRLIPDVLQKAETASKLAKGWWFQAERIRRRLRGQKLRQSVRPSSPSKRHPVPPIGVPFSQDEDFENPDDLDRDDPAYDEEFGRSDDFDVSLDETADEGSPRRAERPQYMSGKDQESTEDPERENLPHLHQEFGQNFPVLKETVERYLRELSTSIALKQMDLVTETNEMDFVNRRQQRIKKLKTNIEGAISAMEAMHGELVGFRRKKERLVKQLDKTEGPLERQRLSKKLQLLEGRVEDIQEVAKVIEYRHKITASDLKLELKLKDTFLRYQNKVQGRVNRLQLAIQEEKEERDKLMHELKLLRLRAGVNGIGQQIRRNRRISPILGKIDKDPEELRALRERLREELGESDLQNGKLEARFPGLLASRPLLAQAIAERQKGNRRADGQGQEFHRLRDILGQGEVPRRALLRERRRRLRQRYRLDGEADPTNTQDHYDSDSSDGDDFPHDPTNKRQADSLQGSNYFPKDNTQRASRRAGNIDSLSNRDREAAEHPYEDGDGMNQSMRQRRSRGHNTPNGRSRNSDPRPPPRRREPLPQLHEGGYLSGPSPPAHHNDPGMNNHHDEDPIRGSQNHRPAPPNASSDRRWGNHDGSSSRREKPRDPDLLSPLTRARQMQGKVPPPSRIPVKITH